MTGPAPKPFAQPIPEITRYFEAKGVRPTFHWQDIIFDEHAIAFTVAKSAGFDILQDVRDAVSAAIEGRQEFDDFRKSLEPLLKAKGWWGRRTLVDPATGGLVEAQLGSTRRLRTIYWANTRTAYAAGQWERAWRTRRVLPFLIYVISTAEHKRELHLTWVGTVLPIEHPWWETHYPPNGWLCQCRVRQVSDREARQRGYDPARPAPDDGDTVFVNKRTGMATRVPNGIDPGWAQNPGKTRTKAAADLLAGRLDAAPAEARRIAVGDIVGQPLFEMIARGQVRYDRQDREDAGNVARGRIALPAAVLPDDMAAAIGAETRVARLSVADGAKQADKARGGNDYRIVQRLLDAGEVIRQGAADLVFQGVIEGKPWLAVLRRAAKAVGEVYLKSFHRIKDEDLARNRRRGPVIRPALDDDEEE